MKKVDAKAGTITFADEDGRDVTLPVTGGRVKLQWKPDFGMRWAALGVDFEMFGKDHQTNAPIYDRICEILGGVAPEHFVYELFLDENGEKISKSKGNGLTIDEWLTYAAPESLALFMFQKPRTAKKLYFDVIPRAVDEYLQLLAAYPAQDAERRSSTTRSGTSMPASRRGGAADLVRASPEPGRGLECPRQGRAVGVHPPLRAGRDARRTIRCSTSSPATRCATTRTSCAPKKKFRAPTTWSARRSRPSKRARHG